MSLCSDACSTCGTIGIRLLVYWAKARDSLLLAKGYLATGARLIRLSGILVSRDWAIGSV